MKKILIVDDEPEILECVEDALREIPGVVCFPALDGREALRLIRKHRFDLVLSDYKMPEMNGRELLLSIKEAGFSMPIIWLSGYLGPKEYRDAWCFGAFDFFEKPFDFKKMVEQIRHALDAPAMPSGGRDFLKKKIYVDVTVSLEKELFEEIQRRSESQGLSINTYVRSLLKMEERAA